MKFFKTNMPMGRTDYYFLDQDGNKIELADAWIEDRYIFGKHSVFDGGAVILNKEILEAFE